MDAKQKIRAEILEKMRKQSPKERREKSEIIKKKILLLAQFQQAKRIGFYASKEDEVDTWKMMQEVAFFKEIALPRVVKNSLIFFYVKDVKDLKKATYGIYEPQESLDVAQVENLDLIIVPGIAFDFLNNRLGRGLGYYDRFLKKAGRTFKLGLGFGFQIVEKLPVNENDVSLDKVITN